MDIGRFSCGIVALVALGLTTAASAGSPEKGEVALDRALGNAVPGPSQACVPLSMLRDSQIIPHTAIIYKTAGSKVWVNKGKSGADALSSDAILVSRTTSAQLCQSDTVDVVDRYTGIPLGFVQLGEFVPYTLR